MGNRTVAPSMLRHSSFSCRRRTDPVGDGITPAVLPHHTDVPFGIRRFMKQTGSVGGYPSTKPAPCVELCRTYATTFRASIGASHPLAWSPRPARRLYPLALGQSSAWPTAPQDFTTASSNAPCRAHQKKTPGSARGSLSGCESGQALNNRIPAAFSSLPLSSALTGR
jgi:hypothetical protein